MFRRFHALALAAAATLALASPAAAAIMVATYQGAIASGYDRTDYFGTGLADLTGVAFTATYRVDTDTAGATLRDRFPDDAYLYGSDASSPVHGRVTINGRSLSSGDAYGEAYLKTPFVSRPDGLHHLTQNYAFDGVSVDASYFELGIFSAIYQFVLDTDFETAFTYAADTRDNRYGYLQSYDHNLATDGYTRDINLQFTPQSVTIAMAAAPEPTAWVLLIAGFGLAGRALRRRATAPA